MLVEVTFSYYYFISSRCMSKKFLTVNLVRNQYQSFNL